MLLLMNLQNRTPIKNTKLMVDKALRWVALNMAFTRKKMSKLRNFLMLELGKDIKNKKITVKLVVLAFLHIVMMFNLKNQIYVVEMYSWHHLGRR